ncbi:zinc finger FYVE domain-containing protein 16-like [Dendronephthya gigantea]|uniref:zinc finger FYVE domain-containing protein 16-like n=1 Tax=Dendronephthya gigantea TaxID=151771 RepID=UPI00106C5194|nr:zinc finger FYVE domain-containing protein 16-like [Dendronephthya gigantea]
MQQQQMQQQQQQQMQQQQESHLSPNFNPSSDPYQYESITSFPQPTDQGPSQPEQMHRTSSLPHLPTQNQGHPTNPNQQNQTQSNLVPGLKAPIWMSDENCKNCNNCGKTFSVTRRKHHCRGCGKIFCSICCDQLAQLPYLGRKVARICVSCTRAIRKAYSDRARLKQQQRSQRPSRSASVSQTPTQSQSLLFIPEDNVLPNTPFTPRPENNFNVPQRTTEAYPTTPTGNFNPVNDVSQSMPDVPMQPTSSQFRNTPYDDWQPSPAAGWETASLSGFGQNSGKVGNSWKIPSRPAGRIIAWTDASSLTLEEQKKRFKNLSKVLKTEEGAVIQAATSLSISVKKITVTLKQQRHEVWFFSSIGLENSGFCEIAFLLEKRIIEDVFPYEMLKVYRTLHSLILNQGERFDHCNYLAFNNPLLGSEENAGFLFIAGDKTPTLVQRLANGKKLLFGILLKQSELLWAKYVPTRLLNALGVQQQTFPSPAISSRDRPSVCSVDPNELYYSTFFALNKFLNYKIPQALIPGVSILKSGSKVVLELPFAYQTEIISVLDSLLIDESKPVTLPIAGDLVPGASGHFVYSPSNAVSARKGFVVLQNSNEQLQTGNQYLSFSAILLVLTFGDNCNVQTRFGISVIEDGISVNLSDNQAREVRNAIYQGTNCAMSLGDSEEFTLRWTDDTCASVLNLPTPIRVVQNVKKPSKGYYPPSAAPSQPTVRTEVGQTNVVIERVKTRDIEAAIQTKIISDNPQQTVDSLENDVRQACAGCLLTFANRLKPGTEKRLNLTLELDCGNYKKWSLGPSNQPINLSRALQLALNEIDVPDVNDNIVFVFNVILQKRN